jgi:hypothetical protein
MAVISVSGNRERRATARRSRPKQSPSRGRKRNPGHLFFLPEASYECNDGRLTACCHCCVWQACCSCCMPASDRNTRDRQYVVSCLIHPFLMLIIYDCIATASALCNFTSHVCCLHRGQVVLVPRRWPRQSRRTDAIGCFEMHNDSSPPMPRGLTSPCVASAWNTGVPAGAGLILSSCTGPSAAAWCRWVAMLS